MRNLIAESGVARRGVPAAIPMLLGMLSGCGGGVQSALDPAGSGAERIAQLFWIMLAAGVVIWLLVMGGTIFATRLSPQRHSPELAHGLIVGGGIVFPTLALAGLLTYALSLTADLRQPGSGPRIVVTGEQWWWRVHYWPAGAAAPVELANEIRLPVGRRVELELKSVDVIHSFWIAPLGGKLDMIPGRINRLVLEPTRTGVFRGVCAEFCGTSHAKMAFGVEVMEAGAFDDWLSRQAAPAAPPESEPARAGRDAFFAAGCGACHRVRGTPAEGRIGPDLTHVGGRLTLGAGILANEVGEFARWIEATEAIKPGVHMPSFAPLGERDITAIAHYLEGLR